MKKLVLFLTLCVGLLSCGNNKAKNAENHAESAMKDGVEVLCFHSKQRCATCVAIEQNTKELIESAFADKINSGNLVFKTVDITENEALADKYEITWSSLVLVDYNSGKETAENLTDFAFANARKNPEKFKSELKTKLETLLNN